jgi:fructokinase
MDNSTVQRDPVRQTGRVEVKFIDDEPHYDITPDCAYDFISTDGIQDFPDGGILYHGTLALRNRVSRKTLMDLSQIPGIKIFLDVNLRSPWWNKEDVYPWLEKAYWVKLNQNELESLGFTSPDIKKAMSALLSQFGLHQLILTRGEKGAIVHTDSGEFYEIAPGKIERFVDTVGAGDAFTAIYIHGLMSKRTIPDILNLAQRFSGKVIGLRGAISNDPDFYRDFVDLPE